MLYSLPQPRHLGSIPRQRLRCCDGSLAASSLSLLCHLSAVLVCAVCVLEGAYALGGICLQSQGLAAAQQPYPLNHCLAPAHAMSVMQ